MKGSKKCPSDLGDKPKECKEVGCSLQSRRWNSDCEGDNLGLNACNECCLLQIIKYLFHCELIAYHRHEHVDCVNSRFDRFYLFWKLTRPFFNTGNKVFYIHSTILETEFELLCGCEEYE